MKSQLIFKIEAILDSGQLNQSKLTHFKIYLIDWSFKNPQKPCVTGGHMGIKSGKIIYKQLKLRSPL